MRLASLFKVRSFKNVERSASEPKLRFGIIGMGKMGQFHARQLLRHPDVQICALVDENLERVSTFARKHRIPACSLTESLELKLDAVIIATPTSSHFDIAHSFLSAGVSCLVEKPITPTVEEADRLIHLAHSKNLTLQVGHIERFNPAIMESVKHIRSPQFIEVNRLGPFDPRTAGIGVVMDLMIHDLDIVQFLVNRPVIRVEAFGAKVLSAHEDIAKVRLHFEGGCIADLSASRISLEKYRRIRIFQPDAYLSIDYAAPQVKIYRKKSAIVNSLTDIAIQKPALPKMDPLYLELDHFVECVKRKTKPLVSGEQGKTALQLVQTVLSNLKING